MELKTFIATDTQGNRVPQATVRLYLPGTPELALGLQDHQGQPLPNPFNADDEGVIRVAAPNGSYDLNVTSDSRIETQRVTFLDPMDSGTLIITAINTEDGRSLATWAAAIRRRTLALGHLDEMLAQPRETLATHQRVAIQEYHPDTGLGGGTFVWDADSIEPDNGGTIFALNDNAEGRFKRVVTGPLCATDFGAIPNDEASGTDAFARMPPGEYLLRHPIAITTMEWHGDGYTLGTTPTGSLTVNGGRGRLSVLGNDTRIPHIHVNGQLVIGGAGSGSRATGVWLGRATIINADTGSAFKAQWANGIVIEHVDITLTGTALGNQGVSLGVLKDPDIGFLRVAGNVSMGFEFAGSSTVNEPTVQGGRIGAMIVDKADSYVGVEDTHHGCYLKCCRHLTVDKIEVTGHGENGWRVGDMYHIKLRDNQYCQFGTLITHDNADPFGLGDLFITSDGNSLPPMIENHSNRYNNIRAKSEVYQTDPGVNRDCHIHNLYGGLNNTPKTVVGFTVSGEFTIPYPEVGNIFNDYVWHNAVIDIPALADAALDGYAHRFTREIRASHSRFRQSILVHNDSIGFLDNCHVEGDVLMDSTTGDWACNIRNSSVTGTLRTFTYGTRSVTADLTNVSFGSNRPDSDSEWPTTRHFTNVAFADAHYASPDVTLSPSAAIALAATDPAEWDAAPWLSLERRTVDGRTLSPVAQYAGLEQAVDVGDGLYELTMDVTALSGNTTLSFAYKKDGEFFDVGFAHEIGVRKVSTLRVNGPLTQIAFAQDRATSGFGSYTVHGFSLNRVGQVLDQPGHERLIAELQPPGHVYLRRTFPIGSMHRVILIPGDENPGDVFTVAEYFVYRQPDGTYQRFTLHDGNGGGALCECVSNGTTDYSVVNNGTVDYQPVIVIKEI